MSAAIVNVLGGVNGGSCKEEVEERRQDLWIEITRFNLELFFFRLDSEEPKDGFFFVSSVASRVNSNCRKFASFAPTFNSKRGDS